MRSLLFLFFTNSTAIVPSKTRLCPQELQTKQANLLTKRNEIEQFPSLLHIPNPSNKRRFIDMRSFLLCWRSNQQGVASPLFITRASWPHLRCGIDSILENDWDKGLRGGGNTRSKARAWLLVDNRWQSFVPHDCSTPFSSNFPNYAATGTGYLELHTYRDTRTYVLLTFIFVWVVNYSASARCFCTPQCKMQSSLGSFQQTNKANEISNLSRGRNNHTYLGLE